MSSLCWLCQKLSWYQRRLLLFLLSHESIDNFCCYFLYCIYFAFLFPNVKMSVIYFLLNSRYHTSLSFLTLSSNLQIMFVMFITGLYLLTSFKSLGRGVIVVCFQAFGISPSSQILLYYKCLESTSVSLVVVFLSSGDV